MPYNTQHLVVNRWQSRQEEQLVDPWLINVMLYINCSMDLVCIDTGITILTILTVLTIYGIAIESCVRKYQFLLQF